MNSDVKIGCSSGAERKRDKTRDYMEIVISGLRTKSHVLTSVRNLEWPKFVSICYYTHLHPRLLLTSLGIYLCWLFFLLGPKNHG